VNLAPEPLTPPHYAYPAPRTVSNAFVFGDQFFHERDHLQFIAVVDQVVEEFDEAVDLGVGIFLDARDQDLVMVGADGVFCVV